MDDITHYCRKIIEFSFYALFFLIPLLFSGSTSELFELNKMWVTWIITFVIAGAWFTKMIVERKISIQRTPLDLFLLLFIASQILATLFSLDIRISLWGYYSRFNGGLFSTLSYLFLYYAFVSNFREIEKETAHKGKSVMTKVVLWFFALLIPLTIVILFAKRVHDQPTPLIYEISFLGSLLTSCLLFVYSFSGGFLKRLLLIILTSGVLVILWGLPSHAGNDPTCYMFRGAFDTTCWTEAFRPTIRMFSSLGQPAWLAAFLAVLTPLSIGMFLQSFLQRDDPKQEHSTLRSIFFIILAGLFYLCLLFANTRAGFVGFWIANLMFWTLFLAREMKKPLQIFTYFLGNLALVMFSVYKSYDLLLWFGGIVFFLTVLFFLNKTYKLPFLLCNLLLIIITFFAGSPLGDLNKVFSLLLFQQAAPAQLAPVQVESQNPTPPETPADTLNITDSGDIRRDVWKGAIDAWRARPIFGYGVETFAFAYYRHRPEGHNMTSEWDYLYNKAHNEYLNYAATTGIVGIGTYVLFIIGFIYHFLKLIISKKQETNHKPISKLQTAKLFDNWQLFGNWSLEIGILLLALFAGWISILVTNFFGFSVVIMNLFLFLIPAFVFAIGQVLREDHIFIYALSNEQTDHVTVSQWAVISVVLLIGLFSVYTLFRFWDADRSYALGYGLARAGAYDDAYLPIQKASSAWSSEPTFKDELSLTSANLALGFYGQQQATTAAAFAQQAADVSEQVLANHPNVVTYWKTRVRIFYLLSQLNGQYLQPALSSAEQAVKLAPTDAKIHYNLGVLYGQSGQVEKGIAVLENTTRMKPDYEDAYYAIGLFYHEQAINENGEVIDAEKNQKALDMARLILEKINPRSDQAKTALEDWSAVSR